MTPILSGNPLAEWPLSHAAGARLLILALSTIVGRHDEPLQGG